MTVGLGERVNAGRLPDWGPRYVETPPDYPPAPVAEPWNTVTAALFIVVAVYWIIRLRGRYRQFPFITCCLPLLLVGGVGGTLFHGLRISPVFFLMDVIPIYLLGLVASLFLWWRLGPRLVYLGGMLLFLGLLQGLGKWALPPQWAINVSYASLAALIVVPLSLVLVRTRFRDAGLVVTALCCFGLAWLCRIADTVDPPLLPMGTHWLWHIFGVCCTLAISTYFYRLEADRARLAPTPAAGGESVSAGRGE